MIHYLSASEEPNWIISALLGAIIGALISPAGKAVLYPVRRLKPHPMAGKWYSYHVSFMAGQPIFRYGTITVKTGIRTRYSIQRTTSAAPFGADGRPTPPVLTYSGGTLTEEADHIVMTFLGSSHRETLTYRFLSRIPSNSSVIPGVWMAYDHDLNPAAGTAILSRDPLTDEGEARRVLGAWVVSEGLALHLRKSPQ
ncbi:hypothetical protein [Streptomyces sp. NBC_00454]|uniref:hypothetical protein n=1 Tax=Streptomyces sp. NBC_00454 TaxID=2975747 RepID=UPI0030E03FDA